MTDEPPITSPCPNCGEVAPRMPYDIGSGRELSCADCEWCWGADGQALKPVDTEWYREGDGGDEPAPPEHEDLNDLSTDELLDRLEHRADELRDTEPLIFECLCRLGTADRIAKAAAQHVAVLVRMAEGNFNQDDAVAMLAATLNVLRQEIMQPDLSSGEEAPVADDFERREDRAQQAERRQRAKQARDEPVIVNLATVSTDAAWQTVRPRLDQAAAALNAAGHRCHVTGTGDKAGILFAESIDHEVVAKVLRDAGLGMIAAGIEAEAALRDDSA